jgi:hypothetical protein
MFTVGLSILRLALLCHSWCQVTASTHFKGVINNLSPAYKFLVSCMMHWCDGLSCPHKSAILLSHYRAGTDLELGRITVSRKHPSSQCVRGKSARCPHKQNDSLLSTYTRRCRFYKSICSTGHVIGLKQISEHYYCEWPCLKIFYESDVSLGIVWCVQAIAIQNQQIRINPFCCLSYGHRKVMLTLNTSLMTDVCLQGRDAVITRKKRGCFLSIEDCDLWSVGKRKELWLCNLQG